MFDLIKQTVLEDNEIHSGIDITRKYIQCEINMKRDISSVDVYVYYAYNVYIMI